MALTKVQKRENAVRAKRGGDALTRAALGDWDDNQTRLTDLLADLMHFCNEEKRDFNHALSSAQMHYNAERKGDA